jgi:hypothetical protein
MGTLSQNAKNISVTPIGPNDLDCSIDLNTPVTNASDFNTPVILLRFHVTLTKSLSCDVILDSFIIAQGSTPLPLCSIPSATFRILPQCGDSTIAGFMLTGNIPSITNVIPNPATEKIAVSYDLAGRTNGEIEVIDQLGRLVDKFVISGREKSAIQINISSLPSSEYFLRLSTPDGSISTRIVTIQH